MRPTLYGIIQRQTELGKAVFVYDLQTFFLPTRFFGMCVLSVLFILLRAAGGAITAAGFVIALFILPRTDPTGSWRLLVLRGFTYMT